MTETVEKVGDAAGAPTGPVIRLVDDPRRSREVLLEWSIEVDGRVIDRIVIRRMTTRDVAEFVDAVQSVGSNVKLVRFPMFFDGSGNKLPSEAIDALDEDDAETVMEIASGFLPRRFKVDGGASASTTGDRTEPSSGA